MFTQQKSLKTFVLMFLLVVCAVAAGVYVWVSQSGQSELVEDPSVPVGGVFSAVDHRGNAVTHEDFLGRPTIVYFGFTFCPDVCPTQLVELSDALVEIEAEANDYNFLFVTVDPERDTPDVMAQYVSAFHPNLTGLTGTEEQIKNLAKVYRIFYQRVDREDLPDAYTMDHSAFTYVVGPNGHYMTHFSHGVTAAQMAPVLKKIL